MKRNNNTVFDCSVIDLPQTFKDYGNISILENGNNIPFDVKRIYYLYDIPEGESRGGHAHYNLEQYLIAGCGSFDVILKDGKNIKKITLNNPNKALHIVPGLWRELENFSLGCISLVLASELYEESDYIRNYQDFLKFKDEI